MLLRDCLDSLFKKEQNISFEVIIADNNSSDDSKNIIAEIQQRHPDIKTLFYENNVSFSYANNRCFDLSSGEYIVIMNPDIIFTEPVLEKLIRLFEEEKDVAAAIPLLVGSNGHFQSSYFRFRPTLMQMLLYHTVLAKLAFRSEKLRYKYLDIKTDNITKGSLLEVVQIPCAFFMTRRNTFQKIGMMDQNFKLYFEDVDLSIRTSELGMLIMDTSIKITHLGGGSSQSPDSWKLHGIFLKSMHYFFKKHHGGFKAGIMKFISVIDSILILSVEYIKKIIGKQNDYRIKKHKYLLKII
jgi:GT2 family glycosyltransferase